MAVARGGKLAAAPEDERTPLRLSPVEDDPVWGHVTKLFWPDSAILRLAVNGELVSLSPEGELLGRIPFVMRPMGSFGRGARAISHEPGFWPDQDAVLLVVFDTREGK